MLEQKQSKDPRDENCSNSEVNEEELFELAFRFGLFKNEQELDLYRRSGNRFFDSLPCKQEKIISKRLDDQIKDFGAIADNTVKSFKSFSQLFTREAVLSYGRYVWDAVSKTPRLLYGAIAFSLATVASFTAGYCAYF